jgi:hypothetical protein
LAAVHVAGRDAPAATLCYNSISPAIVGVNPQVSK